MSDEERKFLEALRTLREWYLDQLASGKLESTRKKLYADTIMDLARVETCIVCG